MKTQHKEQIQQLKEYIAKGGARAESGAIKIIQSIINTDDVEFIKVALDCIPKNSDWKKLNKAIAETRLKSIKNKKGEYEDWDLFRIMCDYGNWDWFRVAGYTIFDFDDDQLKRLLDSKDVVKIEEFSATLRRYLDKLSPRIVGSDVLNGTYLGKITDIGEIEQIVKLSDELQKSNSKNAEIQRYNKEIKQTFETLLEELEAERKLKMEDFQQREEENKKWKAYREKQEAEREAEQEEKYQKRIAEQKAEKEKQEVEQKRKERNARNSWRFGIFSLFAVPFLASIIWLGVHGVFLYFTILIVILGFMMLMSLGPFWYFGEGGRHFWTTVLIALLIGNIWLWISYGNWEEYRNNETEAQTTESFWQFMREKFD